MKSNERRQAKRISYICEIQCEGYGIGRITTRINDISVTGLFIDSLAHLPVGSILKMKFTLRDTVIEVDGEIRYCMPQVGMGVQFINLQAEHLEVIESLIEGKPLDTQPLILPSAVAPRAIDEADDAVDESAAGAHRDMILMGSFAIINLFDVIQMVENSKVTGSLSINAPAVSGEMYFNEGIIVNAKSGSSYGLNALNKFLDLRDGSFEFRRAEREYMRGIQTTSNTGLLLDLLAAKDEKAACS